MIKCRSCGVEMNDLLDECPNCGAVQAGFEGNYEKPSENIISSGVDSLEGSKKKRKKIGILIGTVGFVIVAVIVFFVIKANTLTGYDKLAYDYILEASKSFKNPSSVRLVSGQFFLQGAWDEPREEGEMLFCKLSATNGFGNRTSEDYDIFIGSDGKVSVTNSYLMGSASDYQSREKLDIKKINRKLEAELGDY